MYTFVTGKFINQNKMEFGCQPVDISGIHLFLQHGSKPMGETSGSLAVIDK